MKKNILIIETEYEGHFLTGYIKYILRSFKNHNVAITLLISSDAEKKASGQLKILRDENVNFSIETLNIKKNNYKTTLSLLLHQIKIYFNIKKKFKELIYSRKYDYIFLTSFQKIDKALVIFGSPFGNINFSGIFIEVKFHLNKYKISYSSRFNFLSKFFFNKLTQINTLKYIITNDHLLCDFVKKEKFKNFKKIKFLHDPKEFRFNFSKILSRRKLKLPKHSIIILVYGALIDSKGIKELLSIYKHKELCMDVRVILAGRHLGEMLNYFKNDPFVKKLYLKKKIFVFNNWIDEINEALLFSASDIVWVGYKKYSSPSGVLYQAVQIRLPVIISDDGIINDLNKKFHFGYSVNIYDTSSVIKVINKIIYSKDKHKIINNIIKFSNISRSDKWLSLFKKYHKFLYVKN